MTPNLNPSPEREALAVEISRIAGCQVGSNRTKRLVDFIIARDAALSPQSLPAPGEVEARARNLYLLQGDNARMAEALRQCREQFAFYACEHYAAGKSEKGDTNTRFADISNKALTAVKPATVAASNDEAFTRGVEAAAKVADAEERAADAEMASYDSYGGPPLPARAAEAQRRGAARSIAAAIRLLSQGGGKA